MTHAPPIDAVSEVLRGLGDESVLPRFRALGEGDVSEKAPGDLVTIVDREVEERLSRLLPTLLSGSLVLGEEAASYNRDALGRLATGWVWVVDPLDGTANFVAGRESFAIMIGLLRDGQSVAGWIFLPLSGDLFVAESGGGAALNGGALEIAAPKPAEHAGDMAATGYLPPEVKGRWTASSLVDRFRRGSGSAGVEYPGLVSGIWRSLFYWRTLPWDHVAGTLLVQEAGGHVARLDGSPYLAGHQTGGLLVATSKGEWSRVRAVLSEVIP